MREILFRGKRVDNGEWVCGFASKTRQNWKRGEGTAFKIVPDGEKFQTNELKLCIDYEDRGVMCSAVIVPETLGQYTGLTDKNGKKIFEGDIVKGISYSAEWRGVIVWIDKIASFGVKYWSRETPTAWKNSSILMQIQNGRKDEFAAEIIGNIHDNPELLDGDEE